MITDVMAEKEHYLTHFTRFEKEQAAAPVWLQRLRSAAIERFAELGFPGPRDEEWRFTSLQPLAEVAFQPAPVRRVRAEQMQGLAFDAGDGCRLVFVNGRFAAELSTLTGLPPGVRVGSLAEALRTDGKTVETHLARYARFQEQPFTALNTAFAADGAFLHLPKNAVVEQPIQLLFISANGGEPTVSYPRTLPPGRDAQPGQGHSTICWFDGGSVFYQRRHRDRVGPRGGRRSLQGAARK